MKDSIFFEEQKFKSFWFYLVLSIVFVSVILRFLLVKNYNQGFFVGLLITLLFLLLFYSIFIKSKLITKITNNGILVYWKVFNWLFFRKSFNFKEIKSCKLIAYSFVGYGYRISNKYGVVYNSMGNKGLWIKLKNGSSILIGTQKYFDLENTINNLNIN